MILLVESAGVGSCLFCLGLVLQLQIGELFVLSILLFTLYNTSSPPVLFSIPNRPKCPSLHSRTDPPLLLNHSLLDNHVHSSSFHMIYINSDEAEERMRVNKNVVEREK